MELPSLVVNLGKEEVGNPDIKKGRIRHEVSVKLCPIKNVTVYKDCAEVNRVIEVDFNTGDAEVVVTNLPAAIDPDSVRIKCFGEATIVEVAYQKKIMSEKSRTKEQQKEVETQADKIKRVIRDLENEKKKLNQKLHVAQKKKVLLEDYGACVTSQKKDKVTDIIESKNIDNFLSFLTIYEEKSHKLSEDLFNYNDQLENLNKEIEIQKNSLANYAPNANVVIESRNISALLQVNKSAKVTLIVSYVVSNAGWTPLYDIRAFNKTSSVLILYFATIKQNTGEDWEDANLSLSTAMPNVGGNPPCLSPQLVDIEETQIVHKKRRKIMGTQWSLDEQPIYRPSKQHFQNPLYASDDNESEAKLPVAKATEGMLSTSFEIARSATIQSDNVGHKVSICQLEFLPEFQYIAIPGLVEHAFLKIKAKNDSAYAMLAGDANVFLDNNFLTKSQLPAVSPMEEFDISLGVDPAVKVTYKPLKKYQQTRGVVSKSDIFNYHQQIEIKNTKPTSIKITVTDQCPRSLNEKIKVHLQDPDIKLPKVRPNEPTLLKQGDVTFNAMEYQIDWLCEIESSKTKVIDLRYQIEYPTGETLKWM